MDASLGKRDWPHAPVHRFPEFGGTYIVTAGTCGKEHFLHSPERLDLMQEALFAEALAYGWQLQAWALLANHYHFVAVGQDPKTLPDFLKRLHSLTALRLNRLDAAPGRRVWFNYWETALTFSESFFARLHYVHTNPVKHRLVPVANQYRWCSAAWFERESSSAQVAKIYSFKIDRLNVRDDF